MLSAGAYSATDPQKKCSEIREAISQRAAAYGWPQIVAQSEMEPNSGGGRSDRFRIGLSWNLSEYSRKKLARERADAECDLVEKEDKLSQEMETQLARAGYAGLLMRKKNLEQFLADATESFDMKKRKLTAHLDTRDNVNRSAVEIFQLKRLIIESDEELGNIEVSGLGNGDLAAPSAVNTDHLQMAVEAAAVTAKSKVGGDAIGPAWDLVLNGGYEKRTDSEQAVAVDRKELPVYAGVEFRWKLGHVIPRPDDADAENQGNESGTLYRSTIKNFEAKKKVYIESLEKKIALANIRITQIKSDLAAIAGTKDSGSSQFADTLNQALKIHLVDLADWQARLAVLKNDSSLGNGDNPIGSGNIGVPTNARPPSSHYLDFQVTKGRVGKTPSGLFRALEEKIRAEVVDRAGILKFRTRVRYLGPTGKVIPLGSGISRQQFGVYLAAKNQCNRLYVMWRAPTSTERGQVVVQKKINAGDATHEDCENRGYETVLPKSAESINIIPDGQEFTFDVQIASENLTVTVGDKTVWQGHVDLSELDPTHGAIGFRSDNVNVDFAIEKDR
jgi:hypothetical protein